MNKRKIVFFDIDGTIFNQQTHEISQKTKYAIKNLRKNGHLAYVASGRPKCLLTNSKDLLELDFDGAIASCGAYIEDFRNDKVIYSNPMSEETVAKIIDVVARAHVDCHLESQAKMFSAPFVSKEAQEKFEHFLGMLGGSMHFIEERVDEPIYKISVTCNPDSDIELFQRELGDILYIMDMGATTPGFNYIECVNKGTSKGTGIIQIAKYHDLEIDDTYAIGDSTNDLDMIVTAKYGIAMGNATQNVKDATQYHTTSVNEDGVYHALIEHKLIDEI